MRTIVRTGVTLSIVAALALYGVQLVAALGVAFGIILIGALAGLGVAKWLERAWYGRQFAAGVRAGAIACGVGGLCALVYLLGQGPNSLDALAARSHAPGVDFGALVNTLGALGWMGVDAVVIVAATLAGILAAGLMAEVAGWSKSGRAVRVVAQARLAAQSLQRADARGAVTAAPRSTTIGPQLFASGASVAPAALEPADWDGLGLPGASSPGKRRSWRPAKQTPQHQPQPEAPPLQVPTPAPRPATVHRPSDARSAKEALTDEARAALSAWEDELDEFDEADSDPAFAAFPDLNGETDDAAHERGRAPNHSAFLTSPPPPVKSGKRSKRKRQDTTDWLC